MNKKFYDDLKKDIMDWEKKYGDKIYSPKAEKELNKAKDKYFNYPSWQ